MDDRTRLSLEDLGRMSPRPGDNREPERIRRHRVGRVVWTRSRKEALAACINPPVTSYFFYFTDRQGVTHFEKTQAEFDSDIRKYGLSGS